MKVFIMNDYYCLQNIDENVCIATVNQNAEA